MLWGFLLVILGLFAMMTPAISGIATTFMLGALLLISGLAMVIYAFGSDSFGRGVLRFLFGGITVLAALWMFSNPDMALASLTLFLAGVFVIGHPLMASGVLTIVLAYLNLDQHDQRAGQGQDDVGEGISAGVTERRSVALRGVGDHAECRS